MSTDDEFTREIIDEFLNDAKQLLSTLDEHSKKLEEPESLNAYIQALNPLRMQSGFLDFDSLSEIALGMERVVIAVRDGKIQTSDELTALLDEARLALDRAIEQLRDYDTSAMDSGNLPKRLTQAQVGVAIDAPITAIETTPEAQIAAISTEGAEDDLDGEDETDRGEAAQNPVTTPEHTERITANEPAAPEVDIPELEDVEVIVGPVAEDVMDFVGDFITEATEILDKLDEDLVHLEEASDDLDLLNEIFRAAHTLKGTSSFLGFTQMADLTHKMENVLDLLRKGEMQLNAGIMDCILRGVDHIKELLEDIRANQIQRHDLDATRHDLLVIAATLGASTGGSTSAVIAEQETAEAVEETSAENLDHPVSSASENENKKAAATPRPPVAHADPVIRVDVERLDVIMNLAEELVLGRNRLLQLNTELLEQYGEDELVGRVDEATGQVGMLTGDLQESVMKMRMVPVTRVFSRFPRMIRDLARNLDKQIELVIEDHDTEMDKSVADEIGDPLVHLIRNAVDHGIEDPEKRQAAGKEAKGTVLLTANHEGNHIVIRIRDDGAGMDPEKLKAKAMERGILSAVEAGQMTDQEAYNLIFAPGFSMAAAITDVSGRGVGMDVVKTNITRLNGTLALDSTLGEGTEVTIRLPLTLAIIGGLQIGAGEEIFIIPLTSVIEATRVTEGDIDVMRGRKVIKLRGKVLPLVDLREVLDVPGERESEDEARYVVVVGLAERRAGVLVDRLMGQPEVVIKALGELVGAATGIAGATILGDGRVRLILDVGQLMDLIENGKKCRDLAETTETA